jgi:hypothetical protein
MIFLGFLAKSPHLQLLTEDEYKKLMIEMPVALKALRGNTLNTRESPIIKGKFHSKKFPYIIKYEINYSLSSLSKKNLVL